MAFEQYFTNEWKSISAAASESENMPIKKSESENISSGFDCSICLDFACDPVVTLCGHLYCWPCIYKWFHCQNSSNEHPQCPVCKAEISDTTVVPLYGRGHSSPKEPELEGKGPSLGVAIPPRPPACGTKGLSPHNPYQHQQRFSSHTYGSYEDDNASPPSPLSVSGSPTMADVGVYGEMVYARVFGNSEGLYAYPNSYHLMGNSSPRLRRQEMQIDKSLNRVTIFLFCCFLLCLLLF